MKLQLEDVSFNDEGYHSDAFDMSGDHRCGRAVAAAQALRDGDPALAVAFVEQGGCQRSRHLPPRAARPEPGDVFGERREKKTPKNDVCENIESGQLDQHTSVLGTHQESCDYEQVGRDSLLSRSRPVDKTFRPSSRARSLDVFHSGQFPVVPNLSSTPRNTKSLKLEVQECGEEIRDNKITADQVKKQSSMKLTSVNDQASLSPFSSEEGSLENLVNEADGGGQEEVDLGLGRDLQGHGLQGRDLQGRDLQGNDLQGRDLHEHDLQGRDLQGRDPQGQVDREEPLRGRDEPSEHLLRGRVEPDAERVIQETLVDADNDQPWGGGQRVPDKGGQQHQPGHGGGGWQRRGGGRQGGAPTAAQGQRKPASSTRKAPERKLIIRIDPSKYGIQERHQQTNQNCLQPFLKYLSNLFIGIVSEGKLDWTEENCQQLFASVVVRVAQRGLPGACNQQDIDGLFEYSADDRVRRCPENFPTSKVLTGVNANDPRQYFDVLPAEDQDNEYKVSYITTRPAIVFLRYMLNDLEDNGIEVEVHYTYGEDDNGQPYQVIFDNHYLQNTLYDCVITLGARLHQVFQFQQASLNLAKCIENLGCDRLDEFEERLCAITLNSETVDTNIAAEAQSLMEGLTALKKCARSYDVLGRKYGAREIIEDHAREEFKVQDNLLDFLANESSRDCAWIKDPGAWTNVTTPLMFCGQPLSVMSSPSRFYLPADVIGLDRIIRTIKNLVDAYIDHVRTKSEAERSFARHSSPIKDSRSVPGSTSSSTPLYPSNIIIDAQQWLRQLNEIDLDSCSQEALQMQLQRGSEAAKELRQFLWRNGVILKTEHMALPEDLLTQTTHLAELVKERVDEQRRKELETRELSRSITAAKPPVLDSSGENVQAWLLYHKNFSSANVHSRTLKLKEGLSSELKERVLHEEDPDKIIQLVKKMYLSEDILVPLGRQKLVMLPDNPGINTSQEQKAFTVILNFVSMLEKEEDFIIKFDYSTMALAARKMSKIRQDQWERTWLEEQMKIDDQPLREQENKKRTLFLKFLRLNETLLQRRQLQNGLTAQGEKREKKKETKDRVFSTQEYRTTRFDKRANKKGESKKDEVDKSKPYVCPLCDQVNGHPKLFPPNKAGSGRTSLARCPKVKNAPQAKKLSMVLSAGGCQRCTSASHTQATCQMSPDTPWLSHDCGGKQSNSHNPTLCPTKESTSGKPETTHKIVEEDTFRTKEQKSKSKLVVNLVEELTIKKHPKGAEEKIIAAFDTASHSNWCSSAFAACLPQRKKKKVCLNLTTITDKKLFKTYEYTIFVKAKNKWKPIQVYDAQRMIGDNNIDESTLEQLKKQMNLPIEVARGKIDILIGLKTLRLFPISVPAVSVAQLPDIKMFKSVTSIEPKYIPAGSVDVGNQGTGCSRQENNQGTGSRQSKTEKDRNNFAIADLQKAIMQERGLDLPPLQCPTCRLRSRRCYSCTLMSRPMSAQQQHEVHLITSPMKFDKAKKQVTTHYLPNVQDSFNSIFPPHLSNIKQAEMIARRNLKTLKRNGTLDAYQEALKKFEESNVFVNISKEEMEEHDKQGLASNFVGIFGVEKEQKDKSKLALRLVTHSSLPRKAILGKKEVEISLNSVLPKGNISFNSLVNITLQWLQEPVSVLIDQTRAFNTIKTDDSINGKITRHLRRIFWFENPYAPEKDLKPRFLYISPVHFGDSPSSSILDAFREQVAQDLRESGSPSIAQDLIRSSFVDDNALSYKTLDQAMEFYNNVKKGFEAYGGELHSPTISDANGKYDENGVPHKEPDEDETETETKIFGFHYNPFEDTVRLPISKKVSKKSQGLRRGRDLTKADVDNLQITMRMFASFQMGLWDVLGVLSILSIKGRLLYSKIQAQYSPAEKTNWDRILDEPLQEECKDYMKMMIDLDEVTFKRSPPPGVLTEVHLHGDGGSGAFSVVCYGVWTTEAGDRQSKLLYSKSKVASLTVPRMELSAMDLAVQVATNLVKVLKTVKVCRIFGDSECTQLQLERDHRPKDVFSGNKYNSIRANLQELKESGIDVRILLVRSEENLADPCSKFLQSSTELIHSSKWWNGPEYMKLPEGSWPVVEINRQPKNEYPAERLPERKNDEENIWVEENENEWKSEVSKEQSVTCTTKTFPSFVECLPTTREARTSADEPRSSAGEAHSPTGGTAEACTTFPLPVTGQPAAHLSDSSAFLTTERCPTDCPQHIFSPTLARCSNINKICRVIARIKSVFKEKTFRVSPPTLEEEKCAFSCLVKMEQNIERRKVPKELMTTCSDDGIYRTTQRWSAEEHLLLFGVPALPVVPAESRLGRLLMERAHRSRIGACRGRRHTLLETRTGKYQVFLFGAQQRMLSKVIKNCSTCAKRKLQAYEPKIKRDNYKSEGSGIWESISVDLTGYVYCSTGRSMATRRTKNIFVKKYILGICDNGSGTAAVNFIPIKDLSAEAFATGLLTHIAEVGVSPKCVFSDQGSNIVCIGKNDKIAQENEDVPRNGVEVDENDSRNGVNGDENNVGIHKLNGDNDNSSKGEKVTISKEVWQKNFPGIEWRTTTSDSQFANGLIERQFQSLKMFIRDIFQSKPNESLPKFTIENLTLILKEGKYFLNSRPLSWIHSKGQECMLTANMFLSPRCQYENQNYFSPRGLKQNFDMLVEYRQRMQKHLLESKQIGKFTSHKWFQNKTLPQKGQIVINKRNISKVNHGNLEYGKVENVYDDGRIVDIYVVRNGRAKIVQVSSRNLCCILDPTQTHADDSNHLLFEACRDCLIPLGKPSKKKMDPGPYLKKWTQVLKK